MSKPYVVGIAGGSASGKTTLCNRLVESLDAFSVKAFHIDEYFKSDEQMPRSRAHVTGIEYREHNHPDIIDWPRLITDIRQSTQGGYDVIIVEGHLVLHDDELYQLLDLKLYIECRPDERIVRRLRRNMNFGLSFDEIADVYLDLVRYRHDQYVEPNKWRADLLLNGSTPSETAFNMVINHIKQNINL